MDLRQILQDCDFRFRKEYGQNFITDINLLRAVVADAGVEREDAVLEIGPGGGTLTAQLAAVCRRVAALEIDRNLAPVLRRTTQGLNNVEIHFADALKADMAWINRLMGGPYKLVANLPYYITTPVLMRFLEEDTPVVSLTVMVQKEVAERFTARPGTPEYGAITVAIDAFGEARLTRAVSRKLFYPPPNVDSALVRIDRRDRYGIADPAAFRKTLRAGFAMRRKTLANNLMAAFSLSRAEAEAVLAAAGLPAKVRGEELGTAEYVRLAGEIFRNPS